MARATVTDALDRILLLGRRQLAALQTHAPALLHSGMRALNRATAPRPLTTSRRVRTAPPLRNATMTTPDLKSVVERRATVARELRALEKMRTEMLAEDEELEVAERVLRRLSGLEESEELTYVEPETPPLEQVDDE
jgi:hypothetical protein